MSATENIALENAPQYDAIVNALAEKDLKIAELVKEIDKLHHIIRSARFGVKSAYLLLTSQMGLEHTWNIAPQARGWALPCGFIGVAVNRCSPSPILLHTAD